MSATSPSSPAANPGESKLSQLAVLSLVFGLLGCTVIGGVAGLICGIVARRQIKRSEGRLVGGWLALVGIIISVLMLLLASLAALSLPGLIRAQQRGMAAMGGYNLDRVNKALHFYQADNGSKFPPAENWCDTLRPNLGARATELLRRPGGPPNAACGYGYNSAVAGLPAVDVNSQTVVFFELATPECNVAGGVELLRHPSNPNERVAVVLANGFVRELTEPELKVLRWKP